MITNFRVRNFKRLVDSGEHFRPQPLNVIIGPNDSGKSSLLQSIDFLRAFFMSSVEVYLKERGWEFKDVVNLHRDKVTIHWDLTAELKANEDGIGAEIYEYSVNLLHHGYLGINTESLTYRAPQSSPLVLLSRKDRTVETLNRKTDLLRVVVQMLRELTLRKLAPRPQVIFTTHSPYVLDEFYDNPEEVFLMDRAKRGSAVFELRTSHELPLVKELFSKSLGEAWFSGLIRSPTAN